MTIERTTFGDGPEHVIALHDWMSTHRSFDDARPYLSPEAFTYVFPDLRGYGRSRDMTGSYSASEAAQDILDLADALGWEKFHLLGHSMGGMIAQRLSLDAPHRLRSLILVTPVTAAGMPLDGDGKSLFEGAVSDDALWRTVAGAVTGERLGDGFYGRKLRQHREAVDAEAFAGYLSMWVATDFSADMGGLETPTLVIAGAHDFPAFSTENYEQTIGSWYEDAQVELFENAGHYPMSETPPYFAKVVEDFFARHAEEPR